MSSDAVVRTMSSQHFEVIANLAEKVGAPEAAVRLLLSLFAGYPIAFFYRSCILPQASKTLHHLYFALSGLALCIFNYAYDSYHSLIAIWITYLFVRLLHHHPRQLIIVNFIFHMSYLLVGYYFTESNDYDILWTMPHCVLTLRLIGFGFDIADGLQPHDKLSKEQQETALDELPNLLELCAFAYFPCGFLIGPQFPYRRYKRYIEGEFHQYDGAVKAGIQRLLLGIMYLVVRQVGAMWLPDDYFLSREFCKETFTMRLIYLGLWGRLALYKYICCWLITEGALMCFGFTYAGSNDKGEPDWTGCSNVKLYLLETGYAMGHYVHSFNVNTNHWVAQYVYKRLKFLNNRTISYAAALAFLAVWHGFHSGYYVAFFIEYMIVTVEKQMSSFYADNVESYLGVVATTSLFKALKYAIFKLYDLIYMGWCLTPFIFLSYDRYMIVFKAINFFGFIFVLAWLGFHAVFKHIVATRRRAQDDHIFGRATTLSATAASTSRAGQRPKRD